MTRPATDAPLTWNVAGLLGDDPGTSREFDVANVTIPLDEGMALARPINGHVRFQRTNRGILADAKLTTALQAECSRCLRPMEVPVDSVLEEEFLPALDMATGAPLSTVSEMSQVPLGSVTVLEQAANRKATTANRIRIGRQP